METSRKRDSHQHHRSSSSSPPTFEQQQEHAFKGNMSMFSEMKHCCYYLLETVPLPGPTWSTSEPSVLAEPPSFIEGSMGIEIGENNQASLYTWWIGFLEGLDGKRTVEKNEVVVMEHSKGATSFESKLVDAIDLGCCDDWLIVPTMEMDLGDMVVVP